MHTDGDVSRKHSAAYIIIFYEIAHIFLSDIYIYI